MTNTHRYNTVVSELICQLPIKRYIEGEICKIDLWIMSCRVLKREMEYAMMDVFVDRCKKAGLTEIRGYYFPTAKNGIVREFYKTVGFDKIIENENSSSWRLIINDSYINKNKHIRVR